MIGQTIIHKTLSQRYYIMSLLGKGSFGETYLAEDTRLPSRPQCVVKRLKPLYTNPDELKLAQRLFGTEVEALDKLGDHSQIPKISDRFMEQQELYLVQEYIKGQDLTQEIIPGKQLPESQVKQLLQEILEVLAFVHQHNIIHRDLKPSNLMRRKEDGKIIIIDFGAVKQIGTQLQQNKTVAIGTPGYMPPEQRQGEPKLCSDVYAVGMLGIQSLTGKMPDQLPRDARGNIIWKNGIAVSPQFAAVLDKMVAENWCDRISSASEALSAMQAIASGSPTVISRKPRSVLAYKIIIMVMGLILGAIGLTIYLQSNKPEAAPTAETCKNPPCLW